MATLLQKAFEQAAKLPADEQDHIAALMLDEMEDERQWQAKFARDAVKLDEIARDVRAQIGRGETFPLVPEELPD
ncbi:hypothetical protein AZA_57845 [Nitrospirillum viridazoti Y2]|uniref:Uncharacterized protein n=1 Tax=Nitrospirillum amazonense TaxID=28077 RepID=A0A560I8I3_9PROT|nr:hypothetical protein [Nitrospirillum amazonense]EGY00550.1 hypothetical protein AZA_57845 [Nitrospirillum amazonense Y2]TWB54309.1 hypothetical protein FBZ92_11576 [Nitrospirillum amazonense]